MRATFPSTSHPHSPSAADLRCRARRAIWIGSLLLLLVASGGASCPQLVDQYRVPTARALPPQPALENVIQVVNENSQRIESLYTTDATVSVPLFPTLRANVAYERERRFRLFAETALTGTAVDLGSNDESFWFSAANSRPPTLYYCRHDDFQQSGVRQSIPIEPHWLIDALGVAGFSPQDRHLGPFPRSDGNLEIRTELNRPEGTWNKVTVVDAARGWVLEQHVYDAGGQLVATALTSEHQRDPIANVTVPRQIEIKWPAMELNLKIKVNDLAINQIEGNSPQLWTMPNYQGWQTVDLAGAAPRQQLRVDPVAPGVFTSPPPIASPQNAPPLGAYR